MCPHGEIYLLTLSFLSLLASHLCHQVCYDPATTDPIFIRVNCYPGPGEGGFQLITETIYCILPGSLFTFGGGGTEFTAILKSIFIIRVNTVFTLRPYPTILTGVLFTLQDLQPCFCLASMSLFRLFSFSHDTPCSQHIREQLCKFSDLSL